MEPPSSLVFGKLLYGGLTRSRLIHSSTGGSASPRPAAVRTAIKATANDRVAPWIMYGGPDRMYQAVDMGPAAVLELVLIPRTRLLDVSAHSMGRNMVIHGLKWKPSNMLHFISESDEKEPVYGNGDSDEAVNGVGFTPASLSGKDRNDAFRSDFQTAVGGLKPQIEAIVRRVLDGRVIRPAESADRVQAALADGSSAQPMDDTAQNWNTAALEAEELALLGLTPVRGLLLYGPPGCGKTALAREISRALKARTPKIVAAPELLDRWVGGSERAVRALFADAEAELAACQGDATKSALHVIVIDEIDAVFRKRSAAEDSGEATRSSVVNQILAKLDGVNSIPNVLVVGMTNRRELLDEALLRPGRLEVQIEIPLPDKEGRREILNIHFDALRKKGRLSQPLCQAIDGVLSPSSLLDAVNESEADQSLSSINRRQRLRESIRRTIRQVTDALPSMVRPSYDLAADYATGGFSGADLAGLVRCAGSIALARARKDGSGVEGLLITLQDVKQALKELR